MKNLYLRFREWLKYVRNYKNSEEEENTRDCLLKEKYKEIEALKKEIKNCDFMNEQRAELMKLQEKRIQNQNKKIRDLKIREKQFIEKMADDLKIREDLEKKLNEKEQSRRKSAGVVGGLKAKINQLQKELDKANYTIEYYRKSKKPTLEEIKAYEYQRKAVEKKIKNK